jgi:hypothetical protein
MFRKPDPATPTTPRSPDPRGREAGPSGYHDSSRELAGGLEVSDGTVSALPEDLKQALIRLRQGAKRPTP